MNPFDIDQRIYTFRKQNYHNRDDFAAALKTSDGNIKQIETSAELPSLDLLVRMSILLGISTDHLLFSIEESSPATRTAQIKSSILT